MYRMKICCVGVCWIWISLGGCASQHIKNDAETACVSGLTGKAIDKRDMDLSVKPGDDFFRFVNGAWLDRTKIPDDKVSYSSFHIVKDHSDKNVRKILEEVVGQGEKKPGSVAQKVGDFYATGLSEKLANEMGISPLAGEFDQIQKAGSIDDIQDIIAKLHTYSLGTLFITTVMQDFKNNKLYSFYIWKAKLGLPDRDYYVKSDQRSKDIRARYREYVAKMLNLLGEDSQTSKAHTDAILAIETRLANKGMTRLERRNLPALYNKLTIQQLDELAPNFDWRRYFDNIGDIDFSEAIVAEPKVLKEISELMKDVPVEGWKAYLRFSLINENAPYLSSSFSEEHDRFYSGFLSGSKKILPRWQRVVTITNQLLSELVGRLYVKKHFPPQAKQRMVELTNGIKKAIKTRIQNLEWMSKDTKEKAFAKLELMRLRVGYPDKWQDYSKLVVKTDSYVSNVLRAGRFHYYKRMDKYGKPVDPDEWTMSPQTVNAGYNPITNTITFPAGILQPPFFYMNADDAVNYGAIGMIIAHEITHGFDDQGRKFDQNGNMTNWWTAEDEQEFEKRIHLLVEQYDAFVAIDDIHVNGKLSLGENIADFGGLTIAYHAYLEFLNGKTPSDIDGFTHKQRFFMSFGKVFRGIIRDEALKRRVQEDVHPLGRFRVNGAPFNMPEFYEVFDIREGDKLYRTESQRPVIW